MMIKLLATLFFLTAVVNAASNNDETCYTVQLLSSYKSQANSDLSEGEYPKDCKVMTLNKTQTVRCGCYDKYAPAEARLKELKGEYKKALVAMTYKHRFGDKTIPCSLTPDSVLQGTAPIATSIVAADKKDDLSLDEAKHNYGHFKIYTH